MLDRVVGWAVIAAMGTIAVVITLQVVMRYGFNSSLDWGWAVPRLAFICGIFLGIPLGLRDGVHVGIDMVSSRISARWEQALRILQLVLMAGLLLVVLIYSLQIAARLWDQAMPTLPISVGVFYAVLAFSATHSLLHLVRASVKPPPRNLSAGDLL